MTSRDNNNNIPKQVDRQSTTPFHLKLFYRQHNFHHLSDFPIPSSSPSSSSSSPPDPPHPPPPALPPHLQIYTWQSCTLRELSQLLASALPSLLPSPAVGTRLCFRLIYPDTRAAATLGPDARGRYLAKDLGSVVLGSSSSNNNNNNNNNKDSHNAEPGNNTNNTNNNNHLPPRRQPDDAEKTLHDARFVIGDYVDCAILPPLEDGSVAPPIATSRGSVIGGGMRAFRDRENNGFGRGRGGRGGGGGGNGIPSGDWRRGERVPEGGGGGGGGRRGRAQY